MHTSQSACDDQLANGQDEDRASLSRRATSVETNRSSDPSFEVDFELDDPENPRNWPLGYKSFVVATCSFSTWTVVLYSTVYTAAIYRLEQYFDEPSEPIVTLGLTTYLAGIAIGSLFLAPLSEMYGRRPVYVISTVFFLIFLIPAALSSSLSQLIILRFFIGFTGAADIANAPGTISDVINEEHRALAFSLWAIAPLNGPVFGPLIGGYVAQYPGWRWEQWLCLILGGVALVLLVLVKETYGPAILERKAAKMRIKTGDHRWWSRYDTKLSLARLLRLNLIRPFVMSVTEPICIFWNLYIAVIYGILYLCFVAYPIVFTGARGWSTGTTGLAFLGIGTGTMIVIAIEPLIRKMINAHKADPETGKAPLEAMVSVICIAAIIGPIGQMWFAWTCLPPVHWIWPILGGIPFGAGNTMIFVYATNYLARSYGLYAASAMAGNAVMRSLLGGALPLAGPQMFATLGAHWASTLLGILMIILIPIPFLFWKYGHKIRSKSTLIKRMHEEEQRMEAKKRMSEHQLAQKSDINIEKAIVQLTDEQELEHCSETAADSSITGMEVRDIVVYKETENREEAEL